jgi:3-hydroxy-3-methylglutaryl CoA synthase
MENSKNKEVGINFLSVSAPKTAFDYKELGLALNEEPEKILKGLGFEEIRLPSFSVSNITMVADILYDFIKSVADDDDLYEKFINERPKTIYYATESNDDPSRPELSEAFSILYSKLLDEDEKKYRIFIDILKNSEVKQVTFACAGGGLALTDAVSRVALADKLGRRESAIVITSDTAVYDSKKAPKAETTQGAATTLSWITIQPELESINYEIGFSAFNLPFPDFTKFGSRTPKVYGLFSERGYVYGASKVIEQIEENYKKVGKNIKSINVLLAHVPFPKQAIYLARFLFEHYIKNNKKEIFEAIQKRVDIGPDPLSYNKFTDLIDKKFREFKGDKEQDIIKYISEDNDINDIWKWLGKVGAQDRESGKFKLNEFNEFIEFLHIMDALELSSKTGNSYTSSLFVSNASLLQNLIKENDAKDKEGVAIFYGSGKVIVGVPFKINVENERNLHINIKEDTIYLKASQYNLIHDNLIKGDAARTIVDYNLVELDKKILGKLTDGFHLLRRYDDGTSDAVYIKDGKISNIKPRY